MAAPPPATLRFPRSGALIADAAASILRICNSKFPSPFKQEVRAAFGEIDHDGIGACDEQPLIRPSPIVDIHHSYASTAPIGDAKRHPPGAFDHLHHVDTAVVIHVDASRSTETIALGREIARSQLQILVCHYPPFERAGIGMAMGNSFDRHALRCPKDAVHGGRDLGGGTIVQGLACDGRGGRLQGENETDQDITSSMYSLKRFRWLA